MTLAAAAAGAGALGSVVKGIGGFMGDQYQEGQAKNAAIAARAAGFEQSTDQLDRLNNTIGNITAIRASTGADPYSPTSLAVKQRARTIGLRQSTVAIDNGMAQADQYNADAHQFQMGASWSLLNGALGAAPSLIGAFK